MELEEDKNFVLNQQHEMEDAYSQMPRKRGSSTATT
jgi:hypothetical protein